MIAIAGAGLTGLSAASHLEGHEVALFEREVEPGGLCRTLAKDGFCFDLTGHLLHLRRPEIREWISGLLDGCLQESPRHAFIHVHGSRTPYPFQVNFHRLPRAAVRECLLGFVRAWCARRLEPPGSRPRDLREWIECTFGSGIGRHFMIPYNRKMWCEELERITCEWVSWSVPQPSLHEVVRGAFGVERREFGYNPRFLYPRRGGIRCLPDALAARLRDLHLGVEVRSIDVRTRRLRLSDGSSVRYDALISTMPLPELVQRCEGIPQAARRAAAALRSVRVVNVNLAVRGEVAPGAHWIYFPEPEYVFYRVGVASNFSQGVAPPGCSALYVEVSEPSQSPPTAGLLERVVCDLRRARLLEPSHEILFSLPVVIDPAYVIYDRHRRECVPALLDLLRDRGLHSVGRFGAWEYSSMEDALVAGRSVAAALKSRICHVSA
ncbi:MAG: FAD-dependent oxidoreductase [Acidobacteriota bacterium]